MSPESQRVREAAKKRMVRAVRRHAAFALAGRTCRCGAPATCMAWREELLPAPLRGLAHHGWTMSSQRVREELTRREPTCRPCASRRAHVSRRLTQDPVELSRRIREALRDV